MPSIKRKLATKARKWYTYRSAKRNRAKMEYLVWRKLPRIHTRTGQIIVDI